MYFYFHRFLSVAVVGHYVVKPRLLVKDANAKKADIVLIHYDDRSRVVRLDVW